MEKHRCCTKSMYNVENTKIAWNFAWIYFSRTVKRITVCLYTSGGKPIFTAILKIFSSNDYAVE
jgi:hypothetical protein